MGVLEQSNGESSESLMSWDIVLFRIAHPGISLALTSGSCQCQMYVMYVCSHNPHTFVHAFLVTFVDVGINCASGSF